MMQFLISKNNEINIIKGIGIISVVIGHLYAGWVFRFVYAYHLPLFFFLSGYLFNKNKYKGKISWYIGRRITSLWTRYMPYVLIIGLMHNWLVAVGIYGSEMQYWKINDFLNFIYNAALFECSDPLLGACWFILPLISGSALLGGVIYLQEKSNMKIWSMVSVAVFSFLGLQRFKTGFVLPFRLDVGMVVLPFFYIGYLCRENSDLLSEKGVFKKRYIFAMALSLLLLITFSENNTTSLGAQSVQFPMLYIMAILGIYCAVFFAKTLNEKYQIIGGLISIIGEQSFSIMAVHFTIFKIVDLLCFKYAITDGTELQRLPYSNDNLKIVYFILAISVPVIINSAIARVKEYVRERYY